MTPGTVARQYLELCSGDLSRLLYQLASNAVLEWNGRTIRGAPKIVKFLRQKQQAGLVQNFPEAAVATVQPFEEREAHLVTKTNPPENLIPVASCVPSAKPSSPPTSPSASELPASSSSHADLSYETPPRTLPAAPHPPPLTGGRRFLSCSSDEDDDDDEDVKIAKTPDHKLKQSAYSELQYLEAVGTIRTANEPKHRGTRTTHHIPADSSGGSSSGSSSSATTGDKRTKLKLSYRTHLTRPDEAQFALIIYEHITTRATTVRRNLFSSAGGELSLEEPTVETPQEVETAPPASPELVPLPDSPPQLIAAEVPSTSSSLVQPPGTPVKRRRIPPIIGIRTSPRRMMGGGGVGDSGGSSSSSSSSSSITNDIIQQTWPRKKHSSTMDGGGGDGRGGVGGSEVKYRKLSSGSSSSSGTSATIRKPLRF